MTRINTIPPQALTDQHLLGEYNEILRPVKLSLKRYNKRKDQNLTKEQIKDLYSDIPEHFKLGSGHVLFFYDKLKFLHYRLDRIKFEMYKRGFKANKDFDISDIPEYLYNDWIPSESDREIIVTKLKDKILQSKIQWRYYGTPIGLDYFRYLDKYTKIQANWSQGYEQLCSAEI